MIHSGLYSDGSYGFRAKENGGVLRVWFCGKPIVGCPTVAQVCAHRTRKEARDCARKRR